MIICITNRTLCQKPFLTQIQLIAKKQPAAIILREKDLDQTHYQALAQACLQICQQEHIPLIVHSYPQVARNLNISQIHLSFLQFLELSNALTDFGIKGVSIHSVEQAVIAQKLGASYLIAGHIFETDCKKGLPARGLSFLSEICESVSIPVFAVGGMTSEKLTMIQKTGAKGICIMSGFMNEL